MDIYDEVEKDFEQKAEPKPAPKKAEPEKEAPPNGLTEEEFEKVRKDIFRMWNAEPEETR